MIKRNLTSNRSRWLMMALGTRTRGRTPSPAFGRNKADVQLGNDAAALYPRTTEAMLEAWQRPGVLERETSLPVGRDLPS
jgi:hypothetical protein